MTDSRYWLGCARTLQLATCVAIAAGCRKAPEQAAPAVHPEPRAIAIRQVAWGNVDGKPVTLFTLSNRNGLVLKVTNYGAVITELDVPDRNGKLADIVLGFDDLASYVKSSPHFGSVIGRVANRISGARFELEGKVYPSPPTTVRTRSTVGPRAGTRSCGTRVRRTPRRAPRSC